MPHSELLIKADVTWPWVQSVSSMAEDWQISGNKFFWGCPGRTGPEGSLGLKNPRDTISWAWDQLKFSARTFHAARAAGLKNLHKFINNMRIKHRTEEWKAPPFSSENIWCFRTEKLFDFTFYSNQFLISGQRCLSQPTSLGKARSKKNLRK